MWKEQLYPQEAPEQLLWGACRRRLGSSLGDWEGQRFAGAGNILVCVFWHIILLSPKPQSSQGRILFLLDPSGPVSIWPVEVGMSL